ncbi:MAG: hypothetical protein QM234_08575, partial [Acidobacteriota bacterium]|nr:hypothetical protein [Acidobacteriota bacterium]
AIQFVVVFGGGFVYFKSPAPVEGPTWQTTNREVKSKSDLKADTGKLVPPESRITTRSGSSISHRFC